VSVPAAIDASGLAEVVDRARKLFDDGDVIAARLLAAGAYDQAKAAANYGERFGAAEKLIAKARRLQGDALLIEARAKIRLAVDYDAAQAAGAVAKGRPKSLPDGNTSATVAELGLTSKEVHEARKLAAAELRAPGLVERAIAARLAAGLEPSRANLRAAVGTASATKEDRGNNLYETPPEAMRTLLQLMRFSPVVLEPACGKGAIARELEAAGYDVMLADLVDYGTVTKDGECQAVADFLTSAPRPDLVGIDIVTNPPYGENLNAFVAHALRVHRPRRMALLLNLNFLCGFDDEDRNFAMDECPPSRVYVFKRRLPMMHRDGWNGKEASSRMNTAWLVWELDEATGTYGGSRDTTILRVDWKDFETMAPLGPFDSSLRTSSPVAADMPEPTSSPAKAKKAGAAPPPAAPVSLVWEQPYENGRIVAKLGTIEVGAVFPEDKGCTWAFWLGTVAAKQTKAKSVEAGKAAIVKQFVENTGLAVKL